MLEYKKHTVSDKQLEELEQIMLISGWTMEETIPKVLQCGIMEYLRIFRKAGHIYNRGGKNGTEKTKTMRNM